MKDTDDLNKMPQVRTGTRVGDRGALEGLHLTHRAGQDEYISTCRLSQWGWSLKLLSTMEAINHISHVSLPQTERFSKGKTKQKQKNKHTGVQRVGEKIETNFINIFILSMC